MTRTLVFEIAAIGVTFSLAAMTIGIVATKGLRTLRQRRLARLVAEVRPIVLMALDDGALSPELSRRRTPIVEMIATALLPNLRGEDRTALARLLAERGIVDRAVEGLRSRSSVRRRRSAEMLGAAGYVDAEPDIVRLLDDRDAEVRSTAARALGRIGCARSVGALFRALEDRRVPANTASMAVLRIGPSGAGAIRTALDSSSPNVRSTAAELAGSLGLLDVRRAIEAMLDDEHRSVRVSTARALGRLSMPSSCAPLVARLERVPADHADRADEEFAVAAVAALGRIGHRSAIPVLEASLTGRHRLSSAAAEALAGMGERRSRTSMAARSRRTSLDDHRAALDTVDSSTSVRRRVERAPKSSPFDALVSSARS